jgi:hypothetical protein
MKTKKRRVTTSPGAPNVYPMPSASCPPPGLHRGLHPSHKTCRQLVPSDPGFGHALDGTEPVPFLIEEGLAELEPGNIPLGGKCDPRLTYGRLQGALA